MIPLEEKRFQEERRAGLGGSDPGAMYSLGYGCGRALQYDKRGVEADYQKDETAAMERGKMLEPVVVELYRQRTGRKVITSAPMLYRTHPEHSYMLVHLDGLIHEAAGHSGMGVLEAKVLSQFNFRKQRRDGLDMSYILQVQHALAVTGLSWGSYAILCPDPWELIWFDVDRDNSLIAKLIEDEAEFWASVQNGPYKDRLDAKDRRCGVCPWRKTCQGSAFVGVVSKEDQKAELPVDESLTSLVREVQEVKAITAEAEALEEEKVNELKAKLDSRPGVIVPGARVYYRAHDEHPFDAKALNSAMEADAMFKALLEKYKKTVIKRPLRIYSTGD
jgi:predicted phage-related endonuclease